MFIWKMDSLTDDLARKIIENLTIQDMRVACRTCKYVYFNKESNDSYIFERLKQFLVYKYEDSRIEQLNTTLNVVESSPSSLFTRKIHSLNMPKLPESVLTFAVLNCNEFEVINAVYLKYPEAISIKNETNLYLPIHYAAFHLVRKKSITLETFALLCSLYPEGLLEQDAHGNTPLSLLLTHCNFLKYREIDMDSKGEKISGALKIILGMMPACARVRNNENLLPLELIMKILVSSTGQFQDKHEREMLHLILKAYPESILLIGTHKVTDRIIRILVKFHAQFRKEEKESGISR